MTIQYKPQPLTLFFIAMVFAMLTLLVGPAAFAGERGTRGGDTGDSVDIDVDTDLSVPVDVPVTVPIDIKSPVTNTTTVPVTTTVQGDKYSSKSFGYSNGDVDINDYYRSYQFAFFQGTQPNMLALATYYDHAGLYQSAARARCSVKQVRKMYNSDASCIRENTITAPPAVPPEASAAHDDEDEELHKQELMAMAERLQQQQDELAAVKDALSQRPSRVVVRKEPIGITTEQREAIAEVFKK